MSRRKKLYGGKKKMQAAGPKRPPETVADPKKAPKMVKVSGNAKKEKYILSQVGVTPTKNRRQKEEAKRNSQSVYEQLKEKYDTYKGVKSLENLKPPSKKRAGGSSFIEKSKELTFGGPSKKMRGGGMSAREKAQNQSQGSAAKDKQGNVSSNIPANQSQKMMDKIGRGDTSGATKVKKTDDMSFGEAFAAARKANKTVFMWRGKKYTTKRKGEAEDMAKIKSKKATTVDSGVKKPGLQTSKKSSVPAPKSKKEQRADKREGRKEARAQRRTGRKETTRLDRKAGRLMDRADKARGKAEAKESKMADRRDKKSAKSAKKDKVREAKAALKAARRMQAGGLKNVPEGSKGKGLSKLPTNVRNKMGYKRAGGKKAQFGLLGMAKGAIDGAKGGGGLKGALKGAVGGGMLGRAVGAVKGAMGGGGLQGAMQGFKQGAFGSAGGGGAQAQAQPAAAPAAAPAAQDPNAAQAARYGGKKRKKMADRRRRNRRRR